MSFPVSIAKCPLGNSLEITGLNEARVIEAASEGSHTGAETGGTGKG